MLPSNLDRSLRLRLQALPFQAQALVAELAVEALATPVLPGFSGFDRRRADLLRRYSTLQRFRDGFRPVVRTQEP